MFRVRLWAKSLAEGRITIIPLQISWARAGYFVKQF
jgi:hypothetical protein